MATEVVDLPGIASLLGVSKHTPHQWRQRGVLPDPDYPDLKRPAWKSSTIVKWARSTGRWPQEKPAEPDVGAVVAAVAKLVSGPTVEEINDEEPSKATGFKTKEDLRATIPQLVFRQPDLKHVEHIRVEQLPREEVVYQLTDLEPEEDEVSQAPEADEEHEEIKTAEMVVLPTEVVDAEAVPAAEGSRRSTGTSGPMEPVVIKGYGATLSFDGEQVSIKHSFAGVVRANVLQVTGVELTEPRGWIAGRLRIHTTRYQYKGCRTWRPWDFCFGRKDADAVRNIFVRLMSKEETTWASPSS